MILNAYEKMIAKRYLSRSRASGFIFVVAGFSVGAVALGVAALIIVMSVMNGFRAELFDKIVGLNGHAIIQGYDGRLAELGADRRRRPQDAGRPVGHAADRTAADGLGQWPGRRRAGPRQYGCEDIRTNPILNGKVVSGDLQVDHAGQRPRRDRRAAGRDARRLSGRGNLADQPGRPLDPGRHGAADRHLYRRRDLRGRHLRI